MTLQAELEQVLKNLALNGSFEDAGQQVISNSDVDQALQAILATVSKHLPLYYASPDIVEYHAGFNDCITEMEKTLGADHE